MTAQKLRISIARHHIWTVKVLVRMHPALALRATDIIRQGIEQAEPYMQHT